MPCKFMQTALKLERPNTPRLRSEPVPLTSLCRATEEQKATPRPSSRSMVVQAENPWSNAIRCFTE